MTGPHKTLETGLFRNQFTFSRILRRRISQIKVLKKAHFSMQNWLLEPIFQQCNAKIAAFHLLWMSFGISYQIYDFTSRANVRVGNPTISFEAYLTYA